MPTIAEALASAVRFHQAGNLGQAEQLYRQVLQVDPRQVDALHLLGLISHQAGDSDQAVELIGQALRLKPDFSEAYFNLGNIYRDRGQAQEAAGCYDRAARLRPDYAEAHFNLGNTLHQLGDLNAAAKCFRQAIRCRPQYVKALNNLGNVLMDQRRPEEAAQCYQQILSFQPGYAKGHSNLGHSLREMGRLDDSITACRRSLELEPNNPEALNNLAAAQMDQGQLDEALANFGQAIAMRPDYAEARMNRAMTWLLAGNYREGWPEYEWRWRSKAFLPRGFTQPEWDGTPLDGRTILVHAEQGLGDTLHFVRYLDDLHQRGGTVLFECSRVLHPLLAQVAGIDGLLATGSELPPFDVHVPLLSLPDRLGMPHPQDWTWHNYLAADAELRRQWQAELSERDGFKVGINWQGNPQHPKDRLRSIPLQHFAPLSQIDGVRLICLQKGFGSEQLEDADLGFQVERLAPALDEAAGAFMDTAAVLRELDLLVTSDTAIAHLAGALGVPVWVALGTAPDWRWQLQGEQTPWYPTMRLFRQRSPGDWKQVFEQMAAQLRGLV